MDVVDFAFPCDVVLIRCDCEITFQIILLVVSV